jgi:hypothetical protein
MKAVAPWRNIRASEAEDRSLAAPLISLASAATERSSGSSRARTDRQAREEELSNIRMLLDEEEFVGRLETELAPVTCERFLSLLPWSQRFIHVRWSGEAAWVPLGGLDLQLPWENATSYPRAGQVILYPGGISETELLVAYGPVAFASKAGQLAGNHFLSFWDKLERLAEIGRDLLQTGAKDVLFQRA